MRAPFRWLIVTQLAVLRLRGRSAWKLIEVAELISNGYLVLARSPDRPPRTRGAERMIRVTADDALA